MAPCLASPLCAPRRANAAISSSRDPLVNLAVAQPPMQKPVSGILNLGTARHKPAPLLVALRLCLLPLSPLHSGGGNDEGGELEKGNWACQDETETPPVAISIMLVNNASKPSLYLYENHAIILYAMQLKVVRMPGTTCSSAVPMVKWWGRRTEGMC
ncbi:hypothetical protein BC826DRAFT_967736 [Russula brevipes]|nr:hypothetical protein BC826DRAFT_967736 [Russula brevipes]